MELKIIHDCVNQETGERHKPGDIVTVGEMEWSRMVAGKLAVPHIADKRETATIFPFETRRRKRNVG